MNERYAGGFLGPLAHVARRIVAVGAAVCLALAACGSTVSTDAACVAAFDRAEPRALSPYGVGPLDDAIRGCPSVDAWLDAWDAVPAAHPGRTNAMTYLLDRCTTPSLASTAVCREAAAP